MKRNWETINAYLDALLSHIGTHTIFPVGLNRDRAFKYENHFLLSQQCTSTSILSIATLRQSIDRTAKLYFG